MTVEALLTRRAAALEAELGQSDARLAQLASAINEQGLVVRGSRKQPRPNPLLAAEREERRARAAAVKELEQVLRRLESERLLVQANSLTAWKPRPEAATS
jgi:hypothetical protein